MNGYYKGNVGSRGRRRAPAQGSRRSVSAFTHYINRGDFSRAVAQVLATWVQRFVAGLAAISRAIDAMMATLRAAREGVAP